MNIIKQLENRGILSRKEGMNNRLTYLKLWLHGLIHGHNLYNLYFTKTDIWVVLKGGVKIKYLDKLNSVSSIITSYGSFEEQELHEVIKNVKNGSVFFDIGANVGLYSLVVANNFTRMEIYAFEPIPDTMKELKDNLMKNNLQGNTIHLVDSAVSNYNGVADITSDFHGSNYITTADSKINHISVPCISIDTFVKINNITKIDFIKIDVEGKEDLVLEGAIESISKFKPTILVELTKEENLFGDRILASPKISINILLNLGYKYKILDDTIKRSYHNYLFYSGISK